MDKKPQVSGRYPRKLSVRVCHTCGKDRTLKNEPLKGDYCSPTCLNKAHSRLRPVRQGDPLRLSDEAPDDDSYNISDIHDPFKALFD